MPGTATAATAIDGTHGAESDDDGFTQLIAASKAIGDALRGDILRVLEKDSFGVLELCHILDSHQPALSHHLKILLSAGLVARRREGNSIFYRRAIAAADYVTSLFDALDESTLPQSITRKIGQIYARRARKSRAFFAANAERFATQQALISQASVYAGAAMDLLTRSTPRRDAVLEIGPGDGELLGPLAKTFTHVKAIDDAPAMLERAGQRVAAEKLTNVALEKRSFLKLNGKIRFDAIVAGMVVHHSPSPHVFFQHAYTIARRSGTLLVVELCRHDQEWVREACGDLWLGFEEEELDQWAAGAGWRSGPAQYLAQNNGFRIQLRVYNKPLAFRTAATRGRSANKPSRTTPVDHVQ